MVKEYIRYEDGKLFWIKKASRKVVVGDRAGSLCAGEYRAFKLFGVRYAEHIYIWELHNGPVPEGMLVDHEDRDKTNNRIGNLRLATPSENSANSSRYGNRNCYWNASVNKWQVRVLFKGTLHHAGRYFEDIIEARAAAAELRQRVHGEYCTVF